MTLSLFVRHIRSIVSHLWLCAYWESFEKKNENNDYLPIPIELKGTCPHEPHHENILFATIKVQISCGDRLADQRLCFRFIDSIIHNKDGKFHLLHMC